MSDAKRKELIREGKLNPDGSRPVELTPEGNGHGVARPEAIEVGVQDGMAETKPRRTRGRKRKG